MSGRLEGKVALITGGGTGIGAAIARRFSESGARVVLTGRRAARIESVASELEGLAVPGDTTNPDDCAAAVSAALGAYGGLDVVVANAGVMSVGSVTTLEPVEWPRPRVGFVAAPVVLALLTLAAGFAAPVLDAVLAPIMVGPPASSPYAIRSSS